MNDVVETYWTSTPVTVKQYLLKFLNYDSRCNLKLCSRDDKALVDSTRYVPDVISIGEEPGRNGENSTIYLRYESLILTVNEVNGITKVSTNSSIEYNTIKSRYDVARLWVEKVKNKGKIEANRIKILNFSMTPSNDWILKCDHLEIRMVPSQNLTSWLQKTLPKLKTLDVRMCKIDEIFGMDQVKNTSEMLKLSRNVSMTDEELETILAPSIAIVSDGKITENGAKKAFRKYVENSRPGDNFELRFLIFSNFDHRNLFDKKWIREEVLPDDMNMGEYIFRINGGFVNIHGVQSIPNVIIYYFFEYIIIRAFHFMEPVPPPTFY